MFFKIFGLIFILNSVQSFIVPQEFPSLLSLIYSNVPPIKKGTDSRYGIGFRLGEHADFQVLVELGPQKYTGGIGSDAETTSNKREVKVEKFNDFDTGEKETEPEETEAGSWLNNWSTNVKSPKQSTTKRPQIDIKPMIDDDSLRQLQQLYGRPQNEMFNNFDTVGTLPAAVQNHPIHQGQPFRSFAMTNLNPQNNNRLKNVGIPKSKKKITAELMNVDFE